MFTAIWNYYPTGINGGAAMATLDEAYETREAAKAAGRRRWRNSRQETHGTLRVVDLDTPNWSWLRDEIEAKTAAG